MARQHIKTIQYNGKISPVVKFKTWYGGTVDGVRVASSDFFCKKRKTYNKRNNVKIA